MIWFEEEIKTKDQPEQATLTLSGDYTQPGEGISTITIHLIIESESNDTIRKTLFAKNPSMLRYEEPTSDEIMAKFQHKVLKLKEKIQRASYKDILQW